MTELTLPNDDWPIKRRALKLSRTPYGYTTDPEDPTVFVPDPKLVALIYEALDYIDSGNSVREVTNWLIAKSGQSVSHQTVHNIWKRIRGDARKNKRAKMLKKRAKARAPKTPEDKLKHEATMRLAGAKRTMTFANKKVQEINKKLKEDYGEEVVQPTAPVKLKDDTPEQDVIFKPNPGPQTQFLAATEQEVLYGGAAGGGKSYSLLADPMRYFDNPNFNGILLRKTNDELRELKMKSHQLYPRAFPGAKWNEKESQWKFPSGARMWFTYLDRDEDVERYQGQAFTWVGFDELGHWSTPYAWDYLRSRLRSTDPTIPLSQRGTANPGGVGMWWIKKMFIDPAPPNVTFNATDISNGETLVYPRGHNKEGQPLFQRKFIPAKLYDNPYLYEDGRYEASLLSLPEGKRRQLLDGDWTIADGAAFPEFRIQDHVIDPFDIPPDWKRFRSCDYGYSSYSAVHWYAIDPVDETLVVYRELYVTKHTGIDLADRILELEKNEKILYGVLDSSVWHTRGQTGPTIAEEMIMRGCRWRPSDRTAGSRTNGKNRLHELLKLRVVGADMEGNEIKRPGIQFFNTCRQIIADLPIIPADPNGEDDIDKKFPSDHTYDSIRYGIMTRPRAHSLFDEFYGPDGMNNYRPSDTTFGY